MSAESQKSKAKPVTRGVEFDAEKKQRRAARKLNPPSPELAQQIKAAKKPKIEELEHLTGTLMRLEPPEMEYKCGRIDMRGENSHKRLEEALNKTPPGSGWSVIQLMNWGTFCVITWQRAKEEPAAAE